MEISPVLLTKLLLYSFLLGIALGIANGAARVLCVIFDGESIRKKRAETQTASENTCQSRLMLEFYELYRIGRKRKGRIGRKIRAAYTFVVDALLFIAAGCGVVLLCYYLNSGEFRFFCVLGLCTGFLICHITVGKAVKIIFRELIISLRMIILFLFAVVGVPFAKILIFCKKIFKNFCVKIINSLAKKRKVLYNKNERLFLYSLSKKGFIAFSKSDETIKKV